MGSSGASAVVQGASLPSATAANQSGDTRPLRVWPIDACDIEGRSTSKGDRLAVLKEAVNVPQSSSILPRAPNALGRK